MTSIVPQTYFLERLGGEVVRVETLAPPGVAPETHQITPRQMDALSSAHLYFRVGMPFEEQLVPRLVSTCPQLRIIDTRQGVPLLSMAEHDHAMHAHDEHGHCLHGDDPHIWLCPLRVKTQAHTIFQALNEAAPEHSDLFRANLASFEADLDGLHGTMTALLEPVRGKVMYVFHPAFGYLADTYGLEQRAIEHEGKSPGPRRLYSLIEEIRNEGVRAIFDQPQYASAELAAIAGETGVAVVLLDDLAHDYLDNMERIARAIAEHLS